MEFLQYRVESTIGGDQVHYPGETTAYTAHLEALRVLLNAILSMLLHIVLTPTFWLHHT